MSDPAPEKLVMRWAAVWTGADALRVGHWVFARNANEDLWAPVTSIGLTGQPDRL